MGLTGTYGILGTEIALLRSPYNLHAGYPGFVACHGRSGTPENSVQPGGGSYNVAQSLSRLGPVLTPTLAGATGTWGNDAAQQKLADAIAYLQGTIGTKTKVGLYGMSMNALTVLSYARQHPGNVSAVALGMPLVDLAYEHDNNVGGFAVEIETAYGGAASYATAVASHDPMQNIAALVATGIKMQVWYASDDVTAITARQQAFINAVGCASHNLGPVGHTLPAVPADEVTTFLGVNT